MSVMARDFEEADRRIEEAERELARVQSDETTYTQIDANLARESLRETLSVAAVFASIMTGFLNEFGRGFDETTGDLGDKLNGK